jgi:hypothetical protein
MEEDSSEKRILRIASTDHHAEQMQMDGVVDRYLVGSIGHNRSAYEVGYKMVKLWDESGCFEEVDVVELYVTSRITLNIGILDAFADIGMPVKIMEYLPSGGYRVVERRRNEAKL